MNSWSGLKVPQLSEQFTWKSRWLAKAQVSGIRHAEFKALWETGGAAQRGHHNPMSSPWPTLCTDKRMLPSKHFQDTLRDRLAKLP
jgi:hypothetical protein